MIIMALLIAGIVLFLSAFSLGNIGPSHQKKGIFYYLNATLFLLVPPLISAQANSQELNSPATKEPSLYPKAPSSVSKFPKKRGPKRKSKKVIESGPKSAFLLQVTEQKLGETESHEKDQHLATRGSEAYKPTPHEQVMGLETLGELEVTGRANDLNGIALSASQGQVSNDDFKYRPIARPGELIEVVPGMISTQHSGTGKANQYFLRGFNLDHGTDFTTWIDGIPMNLRTNAHGQGYMDLNSLIPELVDTVEFGKGPYYADQGDFASAGYAKMLTKKRMSGFNNDGSSGIAKFEGGQYSYYRGVFANSNHLAGGEFLYGFEYTGQNGPWVVPENGNKYNGILKYSTILDDWYVSWNSKAYYAHWIATNQIPYTFLGQGLNPTCCDVTGRSGFGSNGLYGSMNPSDGGVTSRYSTAFSGLRKGDNMTSSFNLYALYYDLSLFSDFTYFSANPYQGDQLHQKEHRVQAGGNFEQTFDTIFHQFDMQNKVGIQWRTDNINGLGIANTYQRNAVANPAYLPPSLYNVSESSIWVYAQNETQWMSWLRSITSGRSDTFFFDVQSTLPGYKYNSQNSGNTTATALSPKLSLILGPWEKTEFFINSGYGYHSNDARGVFMNYQPDGTKTNPVTPLAWSRGAETGARTHLIPGLNSTLAVWWLQMSNELVFEGDTGTTSPTGATTRLGVELTNYYKPFDWITLDADFAFTQARYRTAQDPGCISPSINIPISGCGSGYSIPNAVGRVISAGVLLTSPEGYYGNLRLRSFGQDPLNNNATSWLGSTNILNLGTGWQNKTIKLDLEVLNLLDSRSNDIAYWYQYGVCNTFSTGACGVSQNVTQYNGVTGHPVLPRMFRAGVTLNF